jgi:thioredoxin-related protein
MMILFMAAARSIGLPVRSVSAPYWSFTDSNHAWVEVWTDDGWKVTEEGYPLEYGQTNWVTDTALRAPIVTSTCFGDYDSPQTIKISDHSTKLNITSNYGETSFATITVKDENLSPVPDTNIYLYASTFGGLFGFYWEKTDSDGKITVELGKTSAWVTARKDSLFGTGLLSTVSGQNELEIILKNNYYLDESFTYYFPLAGNKERHFQKDEAMIQRLNERRDLANLRRQKRSLENKKSDQFIKYYRLPEAGEDIDNYKAERDKFLEHGNDLCDNANAYLYVFDKIAKSENADKKLSVLTSMIISWDTKDLTEVPDTTAILNIVNAYTDRRIALESVITDSLWKSHVITPCFGSRPYPESGWEGELYQMLKPSLTNDIPTTYAKVTEWLKKAIVEDDSTSLTYYSGTLNPVEILNKRNINGYHKTLLYDAVYRLAGIPLVWKGFMEYYDGTAWQKITINENKDDENELSEPMPDQIKLSIYQDGAPIKAEAFKNFLLSRLGEDGEVNYCYFDAKDDGESVVIDWFRTDETTPYYLVSFIRNENGDANVIVKSVTADTKEYTLNLETPKPLFDLSASWDHRTKKGISKLLKKEAIKDKPTLIFVRGNTPTEPQERMVEQLVNKKQDYLKKGIQLLLVTESRKNTDLEAFDTKDIKLLEVKKLLEEDFQPADYPCLFLVDSKGNIISSSKGYNLSILGYLPRLIK